MILRSLDKVSLVGMALGVGLMLQPWWTAGFQIGFFLTLFSTLLQIVTSHVVIA
jgi:hypothetical protein